MSDDGKIPTNFWLRQEARHAYLWEIFPGDNFWPEFPYTFKSNKSFTQHSFSVIVFLSAGHVAELLPCTEIDQFVIRFSFICVKFKNL